MNPRNIAEYVAQRVIEHIKYRDTELTELREALAQSNMVKCAQCQMWKKRLSLNHCQVCNKWFCCRFVRNVHTRNIHGTDMCNQCIKETCHNCGSVGFIGCTCIVLCKQCLNESNHTCFKNAGVPKRFIH
jgi:hypothetical protein